MRCDGPTEFLGEQGMAEGKFLLGDRIRTMFPQVLPESRAYHPVVRAEEEMDRDAMSFWAFAATLARSGSISR